MLYIEEKMLPLETERLELAPLNESHASEFLALFSDPEIAIPMGRKPLKDLSEAKRQLSNQENRLEWVVRSKQPDEFLGILGLRNIDWNHFRAEFGGALRPRHWKQGYGIETSSRILNYAFETLGLHRIEAHLYPQNEGMKNLLDKLGFRVEGLLRQNFLYNGKFGDTLIMGLLKPEWNPF